MKLTDLPYIGTALSGAADNLADTFFENTDGRAHGRRCAILIAYLSAVITNLTAGTYFTGLMLAMGADELYISYITIATTLCGFLQFASPLLLERLARRKPFVLCMKFIYYIIDIPVLALVVVLPMAQTLRLGVFMAAIILRNLVNAVSISGSTIWTMQSIPPEKQTGYFTFSNLSGTVIGILTTYCASSFVDTCEATAMSLPGIAPTVTAILILRACALVIAVPELIFTVRLREYPYTGNDSGGSGAKERLGLRLLFEPLVHRRFMMTVSIPIFWTFINAIIGEFFNVYLIDIAGMSYTYISLGAVISTPIVLLMTPVWAALIRRFSWYRMLPIAFAGYSLAFFFNVLITETTHFYYFVVMVFCYLCLPCINVVFSYLPYINMPDTHRTAYVSMTALCSTLVTFLGNFFGNRFMYLTRGLDITVFGQTYLNYQYINIVQMVLLLLLALYVLAAGTYLGEKRAVSSADQTDKSCKKFEIK